MLNKPALSMAAVPGHRSQILDLAAAAEERGFAGIYSPSFGDVISFCGSLAHVTQRIPFGSAIQPIYLRPAIDLAEAATYIAEVSGGRFRLGLGVSHAPIQEFIGASAGRPLADMRSYVAELRRTIGNRACPPIILATLRTKMLALATEIADGAVWANASLRYMPKSLAAVQLPDQFFVGNLIPTVVDADRTAARAVHRRTLSSYVRLTNYRNYWKEAGYREEMVDIEAALDRGDTDSLEQLMPDHWIDDCTLSGSASQIREGLEAWTDAGVAAPILVPSSTSGGQRRAIAEIFEAFG